MTSAAPITATYPGLSDDNLRSALTMREYREIADRVEADRPASVLDWGCGFGQVAALLARRGVTVEAMDFRSDVEAPVAVPLTVYPELEATLTPEPVALPYPDDRFDVVLSVGVLEHVPFPGASLAEIHRVLRPDGRLLVYKLPNRFSWVERLARHTGRYYHGAGPTDAVYTLSSASRLLETHGFRVTERTRSNMLPLKTASRLPARVAPALWRANRSLAHVPALGALATDLDLVAEPVQRLTQHAAGG